MVTITSGLTEERKKEILNDRNSPGHPMPSGLMQNGKSYWMKIEVTDSLDAENIIMGLMQPDPSVAVTGHERLGFKLKEFAWAGIGRPEAVKEEIERFVREELMQRVAEREGINI
jgi:hypothetical protein